MNRATLFLGLAVLLPGCKTAPLPDLRMPATDLGPILLHGDAFDSLGARDPYILAANDSFYLYYDAAGAEGWKAAVAISADLRRWEKKGTILELGDSSDADAKSASYAVVASGDGGCFMLYLATQKSFHRVWKIPANPYRICSATAPHPLGPWTQNRVPLLPLGDAGEFDEMATCPAFLLKHRDGWLMFYSAAGRREGSPLLHRTIGLAAADSLTGKWRKTGVPLLPPGEQIENASLYYEASSGHWFLFSNRVTCLPPRVKSVVALGAGRPLEYTDAIVVYWSDNLYIWDARNKAVVLDGSNVSWSTHIIGLPSVIAGNDTLWIFYDGRMGSNELWGYPDGADHMQRDIGLSYLELPLRAPGR